MNDDSITSNDFGVAEMIVIIAYFTILITIAFVAMALTTRTQHFVPSTIPHGYSTPPRKRKHRKIPGAPKKSHQPFGYTAINMEDTLIAREILGVICPSLLLDDAKMDEAIEQSVTRCSSSGRIIKLDTFNVLKVTPFLSTWRLPPTITRLGCLEELELFACTQIPTELATMRNLKCIEVWCGFHQIDFPMVDFPYLQSFYVYGWPHTTIPGRTLTSLVQFIGHRLTNLEVLNISNCQQVANTMLADFLAIGSEHGFLGFRKTLKLLGFDQCGMTESDLLFLLRHTAKHIPNVDVIRVADNYIESLQMVSREIAQIIASNSSHVFLQSKLCILDINNNPVAKKIIKSRTKPDDKEDASILSLLRSFPNLYSFLPFCATRNDTKDLKGPPYASSKVEAFLRLRFTKTHYFLGGENTYTDTNMKIDRQPEMRYPISMNLWPQALQTSYRRSDAPSEFVDRKDATGLYQMPRHGPALVGRTHLFKDIDDEKNKKSFKHKIQPNH